MVAVTRADDAAAPRIVDTEDGAWFLVEWGSALYLDARYSYSALIDDSALIRLDETELAAYERGGHGYLNDLAERVHMSAPYQSTSTFHARNVYLHDGMGWLRGAITAAVITHRMRREGRA